MVVESILEMVMGILELEEEEHKLVVGGEEEEEEEEQEESEWEVSYRGRRRRRSCRFEV